MHHCGRHGVGPERQAADRGEVPVRRQLAHEHADQRAGLVVQGRPAQVDVVIGLPAGRERDPTVHDGQLAHELGQALGRRRVRSGPAALMPCGEPS